MEEELQALQEQGLYRQWRQVQGRRAGRIQVESRWLIHLASNDYLGLGQHPRVVARAKEAMDRFGFGAGSARLMGGTFSLHEELEEALARFKQAEAALVFSTGYMANLGIIPALVGPGDLVIGDRFNHASLIDACRLSKATFRVYPHRDVERLEQVLRRRQAQGGQALVVTEGLFSMDGDLAPLPEIVEICRRYEACLLVDDAHATGVLGSHGRGSLDHFRIPSDGILQMGTLSKALGSIGGFLAAPRVVVDFLRNKARSFVYTTALPPACAAAALEALHLVQEEPTLRMQLRNNVKKWVLGLQGAGCRLLSNESQIVPIHIGDAQQTMTLARRLFEQGVYAPGIRPPTVPAGSARIRTSLTALQSEADLDEALEVMKKVMEQ